MAPALSTVCLALGVTVATASHASPALLLQGGASDLEIKRDYIENKIVRGFHGIFGNAPREVKDAGRFVASTAKDAGDAARDRAAMWHAANEAEQKKRAVSKFFGDPNNVFVVHGLGALVVGCMHLSRYDSWVPKWATPIQSLVEDMGAVSIVKRMVGAFLVATCLSTAVAYKSTSAEFKHGKVSSELCTNGVLAVAAAYHAFKTEDFAEMWPVVIATLTFTVWYGYLFKNYEK